MALDPSMFLSRAVGTRTDEKAPDRQRAGAFSSAPTF
jgi:hypothetical protein